MQELIDSLARLVRADPRVGDWEVDVEFHPAFKDDVLTGSVESLAQVRSIKHVTITVERYTP